MRCREGRRRRRLLEDHALAADAVHVGSAQAGVAHQAEVIPALVVCQDEDDIGLARGSRPGCVRDDAGPHSNHQRQRDE